MTTLILIRHGESAANRDGIFAGHTDVELLDKGIEQAKKTAEYIAENYKADKVYASDLKRAYKTGEIIADLSGVGIVADKRLREINGGQWQGRKFTDLVESYAEEYSCWLNDIGNSCCTDGESVAQLGERVLEALTEIAEENNGKTVVIATHATPIRTMQCILQGLSLDVMKDIPWVSNASVTEITYENGKWSFVKVGEDKHLSALRTSFPANV